jgi:hypothetical protein
MVSTRLATCLVILCIATPFGCNRSSVATPDVNLIDFTVREKSGTTALEFVQWLLVFEGIPSEQGYPGSKGVLNYPVSGGKGGSEGTFGALRIKQSWDSQANTITINDHSFKLTDAGRKLAFGDHTYVAKKVPTTILIGKDGKTREQGE